MAGSVADIGRSSGDAFLEQVAAADAIQDLQAFADLPATVWLTGRVRHRASYGLWVDVEPPDSRRGPPALGLVHLTEVADRDAARDRISAGDELRVRVAHVDEQNGHLGLSAFAEDSGGLPPPEQPASAFGGVFACQWLPGSVHSVTEEGVLVDVVPPGGGAPGRGICPAARIGGVAHGDLASRFSPRQAVHVRVLGPPAGPGSALALSMLGGAAEIRADLEEQLRALRRQAPGAQESGAAAAARPAAETAAEPLPDWQDLSRLAGVPQDEALAGTVHHVASYGLYVTLALPSGQQLWGLVHSTHLGGGAGEASAAGTPSAFAAGEHVAVRIAELDLERGRLALRLEAAGSGLAGDAEAAAGSAPAAAAAPSAARDAAGARAAGLQREAEQSALESLDAGTWLAGVVQSVLHYGVVVDVLAPGAEPSGARPSGLLGRGLVYSTELDHLTEDATAEFTVGQEVRVRVLDPVPDPDGLLTLSMRTGRADLQADLAHQHGLALAAPGSAADEAASEEAPRGPRKALAAFLDIAPSRPLRGVVQGPTPFGLLVAVEHPEDAGVARGLLAGELPDGLVLGPGQQVEVFIDSVDSHRGVLGLSL